MIAIKARFDGKQVILPPDFEPPKEQDVFILFEGGEETEDQERAMWRNASQSLLRDAWNNPDDDIYDKL